MTTYLHTLPTEAIKSPLIDFEYERINYGQFEVYIYEHGKGEKMVYVNLNDFVNWMLLNGEIDDFTELSGNCTNGEVVIKNGGGYFCQYRNDFIEYDNVKLYTFRELFTEQIIDNEMVANYVLSNKALFEL
jgi:hypothetical protein